MVERNVFVTGSYGLVASQFVEKAPKDFNLLTPEIDKLDITNLEAVLRYFDKISLLAVANYAAFTLVGDAEKQRDHQDGLAWRVNVEGAVNLAKLAKEKGAHFIQFSTDYVFLGSKDFPGPYSESDKPETDSKKLTWYGYTKAEGERRIKEVLGDDVAILRIIYPVRAKYDGKMDYLRKPLKLFDEGELYPMFNDQQVSISYVDEVNHAIGVILEKKLRGIFHAASRDTSTPYKLVSYLLEKARGKSGVVTPSSICDFIKEQKEKYPDNPFIEVRYPIYGGLKVEETEKTLGIKFSTWREIIDKLVEQGINL